MKRIVVFLFILALSGIAITANAAPYNIAQGAAVTLNGEFFTGGWCCGDVPANQQDRADSVVDGLFFSASHQWDQGTVWWDAHLANAVNNYITIDLGAAYSVESFIVQADDNDSYFLDYWDGDSWESAWNIPAVGGWGMQTRQIILPDTIVTDTLRFSGNAGDKFFSVSEIQAYGEAAPVPEPGTLLLLGSGLLGLAGMRSKFKVKRKSS